MNDSPNVVCGACGSRGTADHIPHPRYCPGAVFPVHITPLAHTGFGAGAI